VHATYHLLELASARRPFEGNATVVFDPDAATDLRNIVQTMVVNDDVAITGQTEWYPVAFFLRAENGGVLGGFLGDIWAAWLHVRTLAVAAPVRGHGFGRESMKRAEFCAVERGCKLCLQPGSVKGSVNKS
jgi:GNAT superfamily N-acetyltransferase